MTPNGKGEQPLPFFITVNKTFTNTNNKVNKILTVRSEYIILIKDWMCGG